MTVPTPESLTPQERFVSTSLTPAPRVPFILRLAPQPARPLGACTHLWEIAAPLRCYWCGMTLHAVRARQSAMHGREDTP